MTHGALDPLAARPLLILAGAVLGIFNTRSDWCSSA
jgi:hypothetical protein